MRPNRQLPRLGSAEQVAKESAWTQLFKLCTNSLRERTVRGLDRLGWGVRLGDRGNSGIEHKNGFWFYSQSIPRASTRGKLAATDSLNQTDVGERPSTRSDVTSSAAALIFASSASHRRVKSVTSHIDFA